MSNTLTKLKVSVDKSVSNYKHRRRHRKSGKQSRSDSSRSSSSTGYKSGSSQRKDVEDELSTRHKARSSLVVANDADSACETSSLTEDDKLQSCNQSPTHSLAMTSSLTQTELTTTSGLGSMASKSSKASSLFDLIVKSEIGNGEVFLSPFGLRKSESSTVKIATL